MDLRQIRSLAISALFADDVLLNTLVLKGGNALDIVYEIGSRSSIDIDLSIETDFLDPADAKSRIFDGLRNRFDSEGYVVFDLDFVKKPASSFPGQNPRWGGYQISFKITSKSSYEEHQFNLERLRMSSETVGPAQQRKFKIDISKFEFCKPKIEANLDQQPIYVYSLPMIALEKLRAICQQMPEYELRAYPRPRARDFLDIHMVNTSGLARIATAENVGMINEIFAAKEVPIALLSRVNEFREFHRPDWDAVRDTTSDELQEFDFYFDSVLKLITDLKSAGME